MSVLPGCREEVLGVHSPPPPRDNHEGTEPQLDAMETSPYPKLLEQPESPLGRAAQAGQRATSLSSGVPSSLPPQQQKPGQEGSPEMLATAGMQWGRKLLAGRRGGERKRRHFGLLLTIPAPLDGREKR